MRYVLQSILICCFIHAAKAQNGTQRVFPMNIIFKWVNENQTQTVETFSGGGPMYTYERLLNEEMTHIDSAVFWVNGVRETLEKQQLDEYSRGSFMVKEETDTLWFFAKKKKAVLYYYPGAYLGTPELHFIEKPAIMLRAGLGEFPIRMRDREYIVYRDFATTQAKESWSEFEKLVSTKYKSAFSFADDRTIHLRFYGKSTEHIQAVLMDLAKDERVQHMSVALDDVLGLNDTYFTSSSVRIYTDKPIETIKQVLAKHGFKANNAYYDGSNNYDIVYSKSKLLAQGYLKDLSKVQSKLGVKSSSVSLYHEVRLD